MDKEPFKEKLLSLISKFDKDKHHYLSKSYIEAQVRQDFIDPFFEALGWDIENKKGLSPFEREVILEKGETKGIYEYFWNSISKLSIRTIDFKNPSEKAIHDKLVSLVDKMLELHKNKNSMPPPAEREKVEREIAITDERIDEIVYGLYGVTEEERKIIKLPMAKPSECQYNNG